MNKIKKIPLIVAVFSSTATFASSNCLLDNTTTNRSSGSLSFHCDADVNLKANPIYFYLTNNVPVIGVNGSGNPLFKLDGDLTKVTITSGMFSKEGYILNAGESYKLSFDVFNFLGKSYEVKGFRVGEQSKEKGVISIKYPSKPSFVHSSEKPVVEIYKNSAKITEITDVDWNGIKTIDLDVGSSADVEIRIKDVDRATGIANPATFKLTPGYTQKVNISYEEPAPIIGGVNIAVEGLDDAIAVMPKYILRNSEGKVVSEGSLSLSNQTLVNNLPASEEGASYTLEINEFIDNGYKYTPKYSHKVIVRGSETTNVNVSFDKKALPVPVEKVSFDVSGLPQGKITALKVMSDDKSEQLDLNGDNTYSLEVPKDGSIYRIIASEVDGYEVTIEPNNILVADRDSQAYKILYTQKEKAKFELGLVSYDTRPKFGKIMFAGKPNVDRQEVTINVYDPDNNRCRVEKFRGYDQKGVDLWDTMGYGNGEYKFTPHEVIWEGGRTLISYVCSNLVLKRDVTVRFDVTVDGVTKSISEDVLAK